MKKNSIINEISDIFSGGRKLLYEDIPHYIKNLEKNYVKNKFCKGGDSSCKENCSIIKKSYHKLMQKSINDFNKPDVLNMMKDISPYLFNKVSNKYNIQGGYMNNIFTVDGSHSTFNDTDNDHFNEIMAIYCGDQCTIQDSTNLSWGTTRDVEKKIKNIDDDNKEWLINHWIYADNYYKINLIIILLEDAYSHFKNTNSNIIEVAVEFLLYYTCSGLIKYNKQTVGNNFFNIARTLREVPQIKEIIYELKHRTESNIDDFCIDKQYKENDFNKKIYGGNNILYKYYIQNGGNINKLRMDIDQIKYPNFINSN